MWSDPMTIQKHRVDMLSTRLTQPKDFYVNCGGYALGISGWYIPADHEDLYGDFREAANATGGWQKLERKFVEYILHDFPELKVLDQECITNVSVDLDRYEVIAFRIRRQVFFGDFHFMRCERNGDWTEKCGCGGVVTNPYEDVFDIWKDYDGELYFFQRERR